jgi:hypothetical protein
MAGLRVRPIRAWKCEQQRHPEDEQPHGGHDLPAPLPLHDQVAEEIREGDLREDDDHLQLDPAGADRDQDLAEDGESEGTRDDVPEVVAFGRAASRPRRQREGHGDADHEHECRLDQVPEDQTLPGDVIEPARRRGPRPDPLSASRSQILPTRAAA